MSDENRAIVPISQRGVVASVSRQFAVTEKLLGRIHCKDETLPNEHNTILDPETYQAGVYLAGYHIERGVRTWTAYSKAMVDDLGDKVKPYLKSWYMAIKFAPFAAGFDGMDSAVSVDVANIDDVASLASRESLADIYTELNNCQRCLLWKDRTQLIFGAGATDAKLVFVGEAPNRDDEQKGEPFVGIAGQLLTRIILAMGFVREEVYVCNVLKCRPPENRNPHLTEIEQCQPFLHRQIMAINPGAIIALGTFAAQILLKSKEPISRLRGSFYGYHGIPLMPTLHPAFLLKNPKYKQSVWEDVKQVSQLLGKIS